MIVYETGGFLNFFLMVCQRRGSVFPKAAIIALPCGLITAIISTFIYIDYLPKLEGDHSVMEESNAWSAFTSLVGFLIVFRTSQAYSRFWSGCTATHLMRAEWFDSCSSLTAFCKHSMASKDSIQRFQHTLVRLFSMIHALALAEIEDSNSEEVENVHAFTYELIDVESIDAASLQAIKLSRSKVELVFQWIQSLVVVNIRNEVLSIPPPILSRSFQELSNGMVQFHDALKISTIPFPFPYAQTCDWLLLLHWCFTPMVMCQWTTNPVSGFLLTFFQVFILWCLNCIAVEIENPFGMDENDIDAAGMQEEMNQHLLLLLDEQTARVPELVHPQTQIAIRDSDIGELGTLSFNRKSFASTWTAIEGRMVRNFRASRISCTGDRGSILGRPKLSSSRDRRSSGAPRLSLKPSMSFTSSKGGDGPTGSLSQKGSVTSQRLPRSLSNTSMSQVAVTSVSPIHLSSLTAGSSGNAKTTVNDSYPPMHMPSAHAARTSEDNTSDDGIVMDLDLLVSMRNRSGGDSFLRSTPEEVTQEDMSPAISYAGFNATGRISPGDPNYQGTTPRTSRSSELGQAQTRGTTGSAGSLQPATPLTGETRGGSSSSVSMPQTISQPIFQAHSAKNNNNNNNDNIYNNANNSTAASPGGNPLRTSYMKQGSLRSLGTNGRDSSGYEQLHFDGTEEGCPRISHESPIPEDSYS